MDDLSRFKVVITDCMHYPTDIEISTFAEAGIVPELYAAIGEDEVMEITRDADAVISGNARMTRRVIENLSRCRIMVRLGAGYDSIDVEAASERGIYVCNVPDYCMHEVADHAIALMLACARKLSAAQRNFDSYDWEVRRLSPVKRLQECTVGLIGFGRVGLLFAKRAAAMDMRVLVCDPYVSRQSVEELGYVWAADADAIYRESDFISLHLPLNRETTHFIDSGELAKMKKDAILINVARGKLVNEAALKDALERKVIGGAGIDVFAHELQARRMGAFEKMFETYECPLIGIEAENLILTPHAAWYSDLSFRKLKEIPCREVIRVLAGEKPQNAVNQSRLKAVKEARS